MSIDDTSRTVSGYFGALGSDRFHQFVTQDVTWTTIQTGAVIQGVDEVDAAVNGLHANMSDLQTRQLVIADGSAYIEGTCAGRDGGNRIPYCVAYDVAGDRIAAMRAYGDIAVFMPTNQ